MRLLPPKPYRELTQDERNLHQARCRLAAGDPLHFLIYTHGIGDLYREMTEGGRPFAVLSASKAWPELADRPIHEVRRRNQSRAGELRMELKDLGLGYLPAWGVWLRAFDEFTVFAPGFSEEKAIELGRKYGQDRIVVGLGGEDCSIVEVGSGKHVESFPSSTGLRRLVLERTLQREEERLVLNSPARTLAAKPGYRRFWFWRSGGGFITCHMRPFGFDLHADVPGPNISGDFKPNLMTTDYIDAYVPLPDLTAGRA